MGFRQGACGPLLRAGLFGFMGVIPISFCANRGIGVLRDPKKAERSLNTVILGHLNRLDSGLWTPFLGPWPLTQSRGDLRFCGGDFLLLSR
jgi:hypothetical protein